MGRGASVPLSPGFGQASGHLRYLWCNLFAMTARYSPHPQAKKSQSAYDKQTTIATHHHERVNPESLAKHTSACNCASTDDQERK